MEATEAVRALRDLVMSFEPARESKSLFNPLSWLEEKKTGKSNFLSSLNFENDL